MITISKVYVGKEDKVLVVVNPIHPMTKARLKKIGQMIKEFLRDDSKMLIL